MYSAGVSRDIQLIKSGRYYEQPVTMHGPHICKASCMSCNIHPCLPFKIPCSCILVPFCSVPRGTAWYHVLRALIFKLHAFILHSHVSSCMSSSGGKKSSSKQGIEHFRNYCGLWKTWCLCRIRSPRSVTHSFVLKLLMILGIFKFRRLVWTRESVAWPWLWFLKQLSGKTFSGCIIETMQKIESISNVLVLAEICAVVTSHLFS